ncbi:MAG: glycosyltransferase family 4 protein [Vicingaceae bacterium]
MTKPKVLIIGKLPPPYYGPAIATEIILQSSLSDSFQLIHLNNTVNKSVADFGSLSLKKLWMNIKIYFKLFGLLAKHRPELCLLPFSQSIGGFFKDSIFILLASAFGAKVVLQLRGSNFRNIVEGAHPLIRSYIRFCFNRTKAMIVLGENLRYLFEGYYSPEQIFVVPNGCDLEIPNIPNRTEKVKLLYFANFHQAKGIGEVVGAVSLLKKAGVTNFQLNAVGAWNDSSFEKKTKELVEHEKLPVTFHSPLSGEAKWRFFAEAEVFLFPPNKPEGHPWVIVEALAAGLPIISTDQGAITESVLDGKNGFIVGTSRADQLAAKLKVLVQDKPMRERMGRRSLEHYKHNFTEQMMVNNFSKVFMQLLK